MKEAETAIDELVVVVEKEKMDCAKHLKSFTGKKLSKSRDSITFPDQSRSHFLLLNFLSADMKKYADEVAITFNGLEDRYTKLKNVCAASDAKNQVHSLSLFNAYLKQSTYLATTLITFLCTNQIRSKCRR